MEIFADFKVEMPTSTLWAIRQTSLPWILVQTACVLGTCYLLALRQAFGWALSLVICLYCDILFLGHVMPLIALVNALNGGDSNSGVALIPLFLIENSSSALGLVAFLMVQIVLVVLLLKRRALTSQIP